MNDKRDKIIKIVLIIIIILLLIRNCTLLKKKGKVKSPSGNVNIIEIICDKDDDKCDIETNDNKTDDTGDDKEQDGSDDNNKNTSTTKKNDVDNSKTTNGSGANNNSGSNNSSSGSSNDSSGTSSSGDDNEEPEEEEVTVFDKRVTWEDTTELKIFTNSVYTMEGKIAPEASNTYQFVVKNSTNYNLKYDISFIETNTHHINMKYKLKKNNTYIVDHYVSYNELNLSDQLLGAKTNDTYYLEWKWISSDNDNNIGEIGAEYKLDINVEAESTND